MESASTTEQRIDSLHGQQAIRRKPADEIAGIGREVQKRYKSDADTKQRRQSRIAGTEPEVIPTAAKVFGPGGGLGGKGGGGHEDELGCSGACSFRAARFTITVWPSSSIQTSAE